jgi:hypothetical protein
MLMNSSPVHGLSIVSRNAFGILSEVIDCFLQSLDINYLSLVQHRSMTLHHPVDFQKSLMLVLYAVQFVGSGIKDKDQLIVYLEYLIE